MSPRNGQGSHTRWTKPWGPVNTYDALGNITIATDADGNAVHNHYDADNELTSTTRADSSTVSYGYDADGNRISSTDGSGHTTNYAFNDQGLPSLMTSTIDPDSQAMNYAYDRAARVTTKQDPGGDCAPPQSGCTSYAYDAAGELTGINYSSSTPPVAFTYTNDGQRASMIDGTGTTTNTYDSLNRLTGTTNGAGKAVSYTYDLAGNVVGIRYPNGNVVARSYDNADRLTSVGDWLGHTTTIAPDPDRNTSAVTYGNGVTSAETFNAADQLTGISDTNGATSIASFAYTRDANGQLASNTTTGMGAANETYAYDQLNQLTTVTSAGTTNHYTYDAANNLSGLLDGSGQTYDAASQVQATSQPGTISLVGTVRGGDVGTNTTKVATLPTGTSPGDQILVALTLPMQYVPTTPTGYSVVGTYSSGTANSEDKVLLYRKAAAAGDVSVTMHVPNGFYGYSFVIGVYRGVDPTNPIDAISSGTTSGGLSVTAPAITTHLPNEQLVVFDGENHSNFAPSWTPPTGMIKRNSYSQPTSAAAISDAIQTSPGTTGSKTSTLSGASSANIVSVLVALQPTATSYTFNSRGDRTGRTTSATTTSYTYDQANRLTALTTGATTSTYAYDGEGLRASHSDSGTTVQQTWDLGSPTPLLIADGTTSYLYDDDGTPLEQIDGSGNPLYYLQDQYGSTRALTNQAGAVTATYTFDAYGNLLNHSGSADTPLRWNGQYQDPSGLYYLSARFYDPSTAQFIVRDPLTSMTRQPYQYAHGNPLNESDRSGLGCGWASPWDCASKVASTGLGLAGTVIHHTPEGRVLDVVSRRTHVTIGGCLGGSALAGFAVTGSICYYSTPSGQAGITLTAGGGNGAPVGGGFMLGISLSNAQNLCDLSGPFAYSAVTAGEGLPDFGGQVSAGSGSHGQPVGVATVGWTPGINAMPFSFEGGLTGTSVYPAW